MTKVTLHGEFAERVGRKVWMLNIDTPAEAIRAIEANTGKVLPYLSSETGLLTEFRVLINQQDFKASSQLVTPYSNLETLDIVPVLAGSAKAGLWQVVIGVALIAFAWYAWPAIAGAGGLGLSSAAAGFGTTFIASLGFSMAIGGIAQLLTPSPKLDAGNEGKSSSVFSGPVNSVAQGNPVPLGYGRMRIGSQVISFGVKAVPQAV